MNNEMISKTQIVDLEPIDPSNLATKTELQQGLSGKQDTINDLSTIRSGASAGATALRPSATSGLVKNDGSIDTETQGKALSAIQGVKKGNETLVPDANKVVTVPVDIEGAAAFPLPAGQNPTANIDNNHVLQLGIPRGADAYTPFKGTYLITDTLPTTGQAGDYIYVVDSQMPPVTHVYTWNGTIFTDSGETVVISDSHFADIPIPISQISILSLIKTNFSDEAKQALITLLEHVAWVDGNGSNYINSFRNLLFAINTVGIRAEYTQSHTVWSDGVSTLDDLKQDLIVYAIFSDNSEVEISGYVLSGALTSGTSIITVTYGELTSQFNVTVTQYGSVNVYSKSNGDIIVRRGASGYQGSAGLLAITEYLTIRHRKISGLGYGIKSLEDASGVPLNPVLYPFKVPVEATQVTITITPNTEYIALKLIFLVDGDYWDSPTKPENTHLESIHTQYAVGSLTFDIADTGYAGRSDTYIIVYFKPSGTAFSDDIPTNVEITFS